jgi:hypothetical protein
MLDAEAALKEFNEALAAIRRRSPEMTFLRFGGLSSGRYVMSQQTAIA